MSWNSKSKSRQRALKAGYRSGLEKNTAEDLKERNVPFTYESTKIKYEVKELRSYTPDFILGNGIIIETKGRFTAVDRKKHLYIKEQHPDLDIRFVFTNPYSKLYKGAKSTYADWCNKHGFKYAKKVIPKEWTHEAA